MDFRQPGNPRPFAQLNLERDLAPLTGAEHRALGELQTAVRKFGRFMAHRTALTRRGRTATELRELAEAIEQARGALIRGQDEERGDDDA